MFLISLSLPPKASADKSSAASQPAAQAAQSTEDILGDFLQDLEQSDLADFAPKPHSQPCCAHSRAGHGSGCSGAGPI